MSTVRELHEQAMVLADQMLAARNRGHWRIAGDLAIEAFHIELEAATLAFDRETSAATRILLLKSAANLAREAKAWEEGTDLAIRALSAEDLREHRTEIFRIVETLRTYAHLDVSGVTLAETEMQLTIAGPVAAPDFARADEVTTRVENLRTLVVRSAMRKSGLAFKDVTPRTPAFKSVFTPYISTARAASFAVTLKFGVNEQGELELFENMPDIVSRRRPPKVAKVLDDVIASAKAYAEGGPEALRRVVQDDSYAKNAATLLRSISPDAKRIETVGLTIIRHGRATPVALPDRDTFDGSSPIWFAKGNQVEALPAAERVVIGQLLEGNAIRASRARGIIVQADGSPVAFHYDEAAHGDIIDSYWKHRVRARLRRVGTKGYFLLNIDDA